MFSYEVFFNIVYYSVMDAKFLGAGKFLGPGLASILAPPLMMSEMRQAEAQERWKPVDLRSATESPHLGIDDGQEI